MSSSTSTSSSKLFKLCSQHKVSDLPSPKKDKIIVIDSSTGLREGFKTLIDANILSAPVYNRVFGQYVGFLDLRDMISFVVFTEKEKEHKGLGELIDHGVKMYRDAVQGVSATYLARRHPFHPVSRNCTIAAVVQLLATGIHRVPVMENGEVVDIISQSVVIAWIQSNLKHVEQEVSVLLKNLPIGTSPVLSVKNNTSTLEAFAKLDQAGKSGLAVLGDHGEILTSTSGKDLKLWLRSPTSEILQLPILKFLQKIRADEINITALAVTATDKDTLAFVISKLKATRSHRIFVVDAKNAPTRVISLTDILRQLTQ